MNLAMKYGLSIKKPYNGEKLLSSNPKNLFLKMENFQGSVILSPNRFFLKSKKMIL